VQGTGIKICDVSNPASINVISIINTGIAIPHNLRIIGNDILVIAHYSLGFLIYDISDPNLPVLTEYFDTYIPDDGSGLDGAWSLDVVFKGENLYTYGTDRYDGFFIFKTKTSLNLGKKGTEPNPGNLKSAKEIDPQNNKDAISAYAYNSTINIENIPENSIIQIIDLSGKLVYKETSKKNNASINTYSIPTGNYILRIIHANKAVHIQQLHIQ